MGKNTILSGLEHFFKHIGETTDGGGGVRLDEGIQRQVLLNFQECLMRLLEIFENYPRFRFYSSSIFCAYDFQNPVDTFVVYLIDFAHVFEVKPEDVGTELEMDNGFIFGLNNLISHVGSMLERNAKGLVGTKFLSMEL